MCFGCGEIDHRNLDCPHGRYKSKGGDDDQEAQGGDEAPDVAAGMLKFSFGFDVLVLMAWSATISSLFFWSLVGLLICPCY